jgi:opacity protein-like surface antigen
MNRHAIAVLVLAVVCTGGARAQGFISDVSKKGTTAATFLSIGQGARAAAMGSAFVAVADDQSSMYWNPAGLASAGNGVIFDHTEWLADIRYNYLGASIGLGSLGVLGMSVTASSIGDMHVTTVDQPDGTGEMFGVSDVAFSLAYAIRLTDDFAIGIAPKFVYQKIWKMSASAVAMDIGVKYNTPFRGIVLGMSITNFGQKMQMQGTNALVLYDPDPSGSGNNGRIPANLATEEWGLPLSFRVGLAYRPDLGETHRVVLAVDALHPSDDYESVNLGGEYTFNDLLSLRGGYKSAFLRDSEESYTLGLGVQHNLLGNVAIRVDYAFSNFGRLTNIQKFTVGITF